MDVYSAPIGRSTRRSSEPTECFAMRRVLVRDGSGYLVLAEGRPLVSYYANSIAHLLAAFEAGVRIRDALPALR